MKQKLLLSATNLTLALLLSLGTSEKALSQWFSEAQPCDCEVTALAVIGANLFAGTNGGVYLSTDNSLSWKPANNGIESAFINGFAEIGTNLFVGTEGFGVLLSTNNGVNWAYRGPGAMDVPCLAAIGTTLFAGTYAGGTFYNLISRSTDSGKSWTVVQKGITDPNIQCFAASGTNLFCGTTGGVFLSSDLGNNWIPVNTGLTSKHITALAVDGTNIVAATGDSGVFLSTNSGVGWEPANNGLIIITDSVFQTTLQLSVTTFAVVGTNVFAGTQFHGVYLTTNNGASWGAVNSGLEAQIAGGWGTIPAMGFNGSTLFALAGGVYQRPLSEMITASFVAPSSAEKLSFTAFPNPFDRATTLRFQLPAPTFTTLRVYDVTGREVRELLSGYFDAGLHEVTFERDALTPGPYFCVLRTEAGAVTMPLAFAP